MRERGCVCEGSVCKCVRRVRTGGKILQAIPLEYVL